MTAIEVLAATILASLMLASVVGVLGGLARQQRKLMAPGGEKSWHQRLASQIEWDLQNSREYNAMPTGVRLTGFAGRDFANGRPTGRPTTIDYYLMNAGGETYFVRREAHVDARTNSNWRSEVAARGVTRFDFGSTTVVRTAGELVASGPRGEPQPIPNRIQLSLFAAENGIPEFERKFILR
jgi:hypothetical protein